MKRSGNVKPIWLQLKQSNRKHYQSKSEFYIERFLTFDIFFTGRTIVLLSAEVARATVASISTSSVATSICWHSTWCTLVHTLINIYRDNTLISLLIDPVYSADVVVVVVVVLLLLLDKKIGDAILLSF